MIKLYGIANCSTVKKARDWLAAHNISVEFQDFKKVGLTCTTAQNWLQQREWNELINRKGLTWRGLSEQQKILIHDDVSAMALMVDKSSVIKRPILEQDGKLLCIGFDVTTYAEIFRIKETT